MNRPRLIYFFLFALTTGGVVAQLDCATHPSLKSEDTSMVKVLRLDLNTRQSDFSPYRKGTSLHFVSGRRSLAVKEYQDEQGNDEITDLYVAKMKDSVNYVRCDQLPAVINTKYHQGPMTLSLTGDTIYFTTNNDNFEQPKIFQSTKVNGNWTLPVVLPFCVDTFVYCHPAFSVGYDTLWFSSNRKGGFGKMDLHYSVFGKEGWQMPVNAGAEYNTAFNELFPFIPVRSMVYFTSNRPGGNGGLDIYRKAGSAEPQPCAYPVNSSADDFGIWTDSSLTKGYFSSNRVPRYSDDIYYFSNALPDFTGATTTVRKDSYCYTFFDAITEALSDTITFEFTWHFGDGQKEEGRKVRHCFKSPGDYMVTLRIVQRYQGEVFEDSTSYPLSIVQPPSVEIVSADSVKKGECLKVAYQAKGLKDAKVKGAYWLYGDGFHNNGDEVVHKFNVPGEYRMSLYLLATDELSGTLKKYKSEKKIIVY